MSECLWGRQALPGSSRSRPSERGGQTALPATRARVGGPAVSNSCPRRLGLGLEGPRYRPAALGDLGPCPRALRLNQHSRATHARVQGPAELTSCPVRHRPLNKGRRCQHVPPGDSRPGPSSHGGRPTLPDDSRPLPRVCVFDLLSRAHWARVRWLVCRPAVMDDSGWGPRSRGDEQLSRLICDKVAGLRCQPAVLGHSGP